MTCKCSSGQSRDELSIDLGKASAILDSYNSENSNLITLLQEIQLAYGYLPEAVLKFIADVTGIKEAKILGVATFYSQFRLKPVGKYLIMLCQGTACHVNGSGKIEQAIKESLGISEGDMTVDGLFTYINVACLGCCSLAPVMMINDQTFAKLTPEKVSKILKDLRVKEAI
ncbi:MAG: NADH-quinone oxidoreductase subunit NuoE [Clostridiales bacterium]|nr:NADH-quinone oxidoreductase subunit NuoE [Clostridiales bacterium]